MDETFTKVKGIWKYLYRVVDELGNTVNYLPIAKRARKTGEKIFKKAIG